MQFSTFWQIYSECSTPAGERGRFLRIIYICWCLRDCRVFFEVVAEPSTSHRKCFCEWACGNQTNKTTLGYERDEKILLTAEIDWMPSPMKVRAKMRETLFVDCCRANVTVSDFSANRSDEFNPNVSTRPQRSQEFFPLQSCHCWVILCFVLSDPFGLH